MMKRNMSRFTDSNQSQTSHALNGKQCIKTKYVNNEIYHTDQANVLLCTPFGWSMSESVSLYTARFVWKRPLPYKHNF